MGIGDLPLDRMRERGMWPPSTKRIGAGNVESTMGLITPIWPVDPLGSFRFSVDNRAKAATPVLQAGVNKVEIQKDNTLVKVIREIDFRITTPNKFLGLNDVRLSAYVEGTPIREFYNLAVGNGARIKTKIAVPPQSTFELQVSVPPVPTALPVPTYAGRIYAAAVQYNGQVYVFGGRQAANPLLGVVDYLVSNDNGNTWTSKPYPFAFSGGAQTNCNAFVWKNLVYLFVSELVASTVYGSIYTFDGAEFALKHRFPGVGPVTNLGDLFYFDSLRNIIVNPISGRFIYFNADGLGGIYYSDDLGLTWINPQVSFFPSGLYGTDWDAGSVLYLNGAYWGFGRWYTGSTWQVGIMRYPENLTTGSGDFGKTNIPTVYDYWVLLRDNKVYITNGVSVQGNYSSVYRVNNLYAVSADQVQSMNWYLEAADEPYMLRQAFVALTLDNRSFLFVTGLDEVTPYKVPTFKDIAGLGLEWYLSVSGTKLPLKQSVQRTLITP